VIYETPPAPLSAEDEPSRDSIVSVETFQQAVTRRINSFETEIAAGGKVETIDLPDWRNNAPPPH
jgi:hypothetical protein